MLRNLLTSTALAVCLLPSVAGAANLFVGPGKTYSTISAAVNAASSGDWILIDPGTYTNDYLSISTSNLNIYGNGGVATIVNTASAIPNGKGIIVINSGANNTLLGNLELTGAAVSSGNGAGVRAQGGDVKIEWCYIHDNEEGFLGGDGAGVDIEHTNFDHNGDGSGQTHNVYVGVASWLVFWDNWTHNVVTGHLLKSRAEYNWISTNRITEETSGNASIDIDLPAGGESYVMGNIIEKSSTSENNTSMLSYGEEPGNGLNPTQALYVTYNTFVNDSGSTSTLAVRVTGTVSGVLKNNLYVTGGSSGTLISGGSLTASNNLVTNSPSFVNRSSYDYRLSSSFTAAIDAGVVLGSSPTSVALTPADQYWHQVWDSTRTVAGSFPDIGAFEYGASP
jgi:hypothetical protein